MSLRFRTKLNLGLRTKLTGRPLYVHMGLRLLLWMLLHNIQHPPPVEHYRPCALVNTISDSLTNSLNPKLTYESLVKGVFIREGQTANKNSFTVSWFPLSFRSEITTLLLSVFAKRHQMLLLVTCRVVVEK